MSFDLAFSRRSLVQYAAALVFELPVVPVAVVPTGWLACAGLVDRATWDALCEGGAACAKLGTSSIAIVARKANKNLGMSITSLIPCSILCLP
jgi:hypothetical protein